MLPTTAGYYFPIATFFFFFFLRITQTLVWISVTVSRRPCLVTGSGFLNAFIQVLSLGSSTA